MLIRVALRGLIRFWLVHGSVGGTLTNLAFSGGIPASGELYRTDGIDIKVESVNFMFSVEF